MKFSEKIDVVASCDLRLNAERGAEKTKPKSVHKSFRTGPFIRTSDLKYILWTLLLCCYIHLTQKTQFSKVTTNKLNQKA